MKKFSDWWKKKYQEPMWGLEGDSQEFAFKRFIQGVSDYIDEVVSQPKLKPPITLSEEQLKVLSKGVTLISPGTGYTSEPAGLQPPVRPWKEL